MCSGRAAGEGVAAAKPVSRLKPRWQDLSSIDLEGGSMDALSSEEEGASLLAGVGSGTGILEFSAARAGLDVIPADVEFIDDTQHRKSPPLVLSALAGQLCRCTTL